MNPAASSRDAVMPVPSSHALSAPTGDSGVPSTSVPSTHVPLPRKRRGTFKAQKDSRIYKTVMSIIAMRAQGIPRSDIADALGITMNTLQTYLGRANAKGWINLASFTNPDDQLEVVIRSKTVRNVNEFLDLRSEKVTIEAAKGLGMFKQHQVVKSEGQGPTVLALKVHVEMPTAPPSASLVQLNPANVGGSYARGIPPGVDVIDADVERS